MSVSAALGGIVKRREDPRLVTGAGKYTDDIHVDGCLHAAFVRSTMAHARIVRVDIGAAAAMPGVAGVFVAADLGLKAVAQFPAPDSMARPPLAAEVVRFSEQAHIRLRGQGFASTAVPDHEVTVYNGSGAAIDVILSRCRADGSEIERQAAHFELARGPAGWRMIGIQSTRTAADSLNTVWFR